MGATLKSQSDLTVQGDVVGRDKIVTNIRHIYQRALTAIEEAELAKSSEAKALAQGVSAFAQRLQARASEPSQGGDPYKGLLAYRLSDAELFFGRSQAIVEFLPHLQNSPLTILHAESGAGKTSLLQAGIAPQLIAAGHLPVYLRPYNVEPSLAIKRAFLSDPSQTPILATAPLRDFLRRVCEVFSLTWTSTTQTVRRGASRKTRPTDETLVSGKRTSLLSPTRLYICLDQFEEFFTQLEEPARAEFIRELAECLDDESLNVRWILALRTEHFGNLASFRPRIRNPFENDYRLNRLTRAEARAAVVQPAARRGLLYEPGLVDRLLDDLGKDTVYPPQIQLVCSALYAALKLGEATITEAMYQAEGGAAGILHDHLERVLNRDLTPEQRPIARRVLEALMTSQGQRAIRTHSELAAEVPAPEALDAVLDQLVNSALIHVHESRTPSEFAYELTHDYLLDEIKLDPAVQARKAAQELLEQEVQAHRRYGTLLSDDKLAIITARQAELPLNEETQSLLDLSHRALKRRRGFVLSGVGLIVLLVIIGLGSVLTAIGAQGERQSAIGTQVAAETAAADALNQQIAAQSEVQLAQTQQAASEAAAATALAREAIAKAVVQTQFQRTKVIPVGNEPAALAFDGALIWVANQNDDTVQAVDPGAGIFYGPIPVGKHPSAILFDGNQLWVANTNDHTLQSVDLTTWQTSEPIPVGQLPLAMAFDGARIWIANQGDSTVQAIDAATHEVSAPISVGLRPSALVFDGTRLWIANPGDNTVQALDLNTGRLNAALPVGAFPNSLAFDGTRVWVANRDQGTVQMIHPATGVVEAAIQVGTYPSSLTFDGTRLWVANTGDNTVQAIDPNTGDISAPITVGAKPIALLMAGEQLWVANRDDSTIQGINPTMGDAGPPILVGNNPNALAFDGTRVWVANQWSDTVQALNLTTNQVGAPIQVGAWPSALFFDNAQLWVTNMNGFSVQAINLTTDEAGQPIQVGVGPSALAFDGTQLWVANRYENTIQSVDPNTGQAGEPITVGANPTALLFDGQRVWVANAGDNTVQAIDPTTGSAAPAMRVGLGPNAFAFDGTRIWVANFGDNTIQSIDPNTGELGSPLRVGKSPAALAFDAQRLWVANQGDNNVRSINIETGEVSAPIPVGLAPSALVFDGGRLWVANAESNTVQYIVIHR